MILRLDKLAIDIRCPTSRIRTETARKWSSSTARRKAPRPELPVEPAIGVPGFHPAEIGELAGKPMARAR